MKFIKYIKPTYLALPFLFFFLKDAVKLLNPYISPAIFLEHKQEIPLIILMILFIGYAYGLIIMLNFKELVQRNILKKITVIIFLGILVRILYALVLPATNDEGSYLFDSLLISQGSSPFHFSFARSPALVYPLSVFIKIFGNSLLVGRIFSILCAVGISAFMYLIGKGIKRPQFSFIAIFIFSLFPPFIYDTVYTHTQPITLLYGISSFYFLTISQDNKKKLMLSFALLALAVLVREAAVFYLPVWIIISLIRNKVKNTAIGLLTFGIVYTVVWGLIGLDVGFARVFNDLYALANQRADELTLYRKFELRINMLRQNLFYLVGYLLMFLLFVGSWLVKASVRLKDFWVILFAVLAILFVKSVPNTLVVSKTDDYYVFYVIASVIFSFGSIYYLQNLKHELAKSNKLETFNLLSYFIVPFAFYVFWYSNFQTEYWIEFLLPSVLFAAYLGYKNIGHNIFLPLTIIFIFNLGAAYRVVQVPQRGTYSIENLLSVLDYLDKNDHQDKIFTGAVIIPFLSGHSLSSNISHPAIYCNCTPLPDSVIYSLYPKEESIINNLENDDVRTILVEKITSDVFITRRPKIREYIASNYEQITVIGTENPITVYKKIK